MEFIKEIRKDKKEQMKEWRKDIEDFPHINSMARHSIKYPSMFFFYSWLTVKTNWSRY